MSVSTDLTEARGVIKEMSGILQEFFTDRRRIFIPRKHLSEEAYRLYDYYRDKY